MFFLWFSIITVPCYTNEFQELLLNLLNYSRNTFTVYNNISSLLGLSCEHIDQSYKNEQTQIVNMSLDSMLKYN